VDFSRLEQGVLDSLARGEAVDADALLFLLRRYRTTDRADLGETLGVALSLALDASRDAPESGTRAAWLTLFVEALSLSEDERLLTAANDLIAALPSDWAAATSPGCAALSIGACLAAADLPDALALIPEAIDALELLIAKAYRPGVGIVGTPLDQIRTSATLLTAYEVSGRLPYSMLAEELVQLTKRAGDDDLAAGCEKARLLCRLAALLDDADYRAAAVVAPDTDYGADARRIVGALTPAPARAADAGAYGLALIDLAARLDQK